MGQFNNLRVSLDQLKFYLDAANSYSYSGGTVLKDINTLEVEVEITEIKGDLK